MKKFIPVLIFFFSLAVVIYFGITRIIIPNVEKLETYHYLIIGAAVLLPFMLGIAIVVFFNRNKDKKMELLNTRLKQWSNLSVHVNRAGDEVFKFLPIGIIIYDNNLKIKWVNNHAKEIFNDELIESSLSELNLGLYNYVKEQSQQNIIQINDQYYEIRQKDDEQIIYLFDITKQEIMKRKYFDRTLAVGIITLDNIEMELKNRDMQDYAQIQGAFLGEISEWASSYDGYIRSYEDDSLIVLFDQAKLIEIMKNKFDILERIRDISSKNNVRVTLSIGFACGDIDLKELGQLAQNAIDLAEKRGGDQAVVNIVGEKIQYFGARTNALEKNNLLAARTHTLALKDEIEDASEVYIMGHNMADADCFGACIAVLRMVLSSKKAVKIIMDYYKIDQTTQKIYDSIAKKEPELLNYFISDSAVHNVSSESLLIVVDTQSPKLAMNETLLYEFKKVAVIDHHRSSDEGFVDTVFSYVEPYASSTVELLTEMFQFYQKNGIKITPFDATVMLAGIVVDTNNYTFRCGTRTFEAASTLREYGADTVEIKRLLRNDLKLQVELSKYVQKSELILNKFAVCAFDQDDIVNDRTILAKVADYLLNIDNVEASFVIAGYEEETNSGVAISARSYQDVNVQVLMEEMGGGGHLNSAATQISGETVNDVKERLIGILRRDYEVGDTKMKIILLEDVKGRGNKNEIIDVASGFGNYLVTNKKAIVATDENVAALKEKLHQEEVEEQNQRKLMQKIKEEIETKSVNIYIRRGKDGKAYGRVTTKEICDEFEAQTGIHLDKRKVSLPIEINALGTYNATVDLFKDIKASFEINVFEK